MLGMSCSTHITRVSEASAVMNVVWHGKLLALCIVGIYLWCEVWPSDWDQVE